MRIKPDKFEACLARIAAKGKMNKAQAMRLLNEVGTRAEQMRLSGKADPFVTAAKELAATLKENVKLDRLDALRNHALRKSVMDLIESEGGLARAGDTLRSLLHGTNIGGRDSAESQWRGLARGLHAQMEWALKKAGVYDAMVSGEADKDLAMEMMASREGKASVSGNKAARAMADAVVPVLDLLRDRLNAAGARIGKAVDFVHHMSHDPLKMLNAGGADKSEQGSFKAWWNFAEPLLAEKTFDDVTPREGETRAQARARFGQSVFEALTTGVHMTADPATALKERGDYVAPAFEGSRNLAKGLSESRVLFFKDGEAWNSYAKKFSRFRTIGEGVIASIEQGARNLALMEKFGTNPTANFNLILRRVREVYRNDIAGVNAFRDNKMPGLEMVMMHLDGRANIPANQMWARIGSGIRTWEAVSSLGGVGVTHFASIWPTVTSEGVHHGVPRLQMLGNMIAALVKGRGSEERQEIMAQLGAYSAGLTRDMHARWQPDDPIPGRLSAMATTFMKWTGIHYIFDHTQAGFTETLANQLARYAGKAFGELDPHLSQILGKYGIGEDEWNLLRAVPDLPVADGMAYMTPKDVMRIDPAAAEALLRTRGTLGEGASDELIAKSVTRLRNELSDKLYSYYGDSASRSTVTAGVRERAMVLRNLRPGDPWGELARFAVQFKMWPLAAMQQVIGREIHLSLSKKEAAWNLGILAALSMAAGYMRMSVSDTLTGRPVRDPRDPNTMIAALAQGGGVGVLGDFLFGEVNRFGGGLVGTVGGPAVGDADQLVKLYGQWRKGEAGWPDLAHFAVRHVPFANLVYLKGMLDYSIWYHLYEAASPGWWERTNRRLIRDQGRPMLGYKPGRGVPWPTDVGIMGLVTGREARAAPSPAGPQLALASNAGGGSQGQGAVAQPQFG